MNKGLLEDLAEVTGCNCISELKMLPKRADIARRLKYLDVDAYSLKEWNDAVHYLTGGSQSFQTAEEACRFLLWCGGCEEMENEFF